ncbi:MAG: AAC(3) family N-acetyltransferase [Lachnospiraceae bacterium]|nr:AAC(3) family N-acetyltransferase [Lachnospiraceae bacterium]
MHTRETLVEDIRRLGVAKDDILLVHSSMKAIGEVDGGADTVLDALTEAVCDGMLILPTHTWSVMSNEYPIYDPEKEPACVGILPNLFRKREGVMRSLHPTHSVAAYSKNQKLLQEFISGEEQFSTPCPRQGCYGKLYDLNAKVLMLGVGLNRYTYLHGVEEWFGIEERLEKEALSLQIKLPSGELLPVSMHKHFKPNNISVSEYYIKMEKPFVQAGALKKGRIGDAQSMLLLARQTADITTEYLRKDKDIFLSHNPL